MLLHKYFVVNTVTDMVILSSKMMFESIVFVCPLENARTHILHVGLKTAKFPKNRCAPG